MLYPRGRSEKLRRRAGERFQKVVHGLLILLGCVGPAGHKPAGRICIFASQLIKPGCRGPAHFLKECNLRSLVVDAFLESSLGPFVIYFDTRLKKHFVETEAEALGGMSVSSPLAQSIAGVSGFLRQSAGEGADKSVIGRIRSLDDAQNFRYPL